MMSLRTAALAFTALALALPANSALSSDGPAALTSALNNLAAQHHGFVGFHRHYVLAQRAPGHNQNSLADAGRLRDDGRIVWGRLYSRDTDGKTASAEDISKVNAQFDRKPPNEDLGTLPLTSQALSAYRLASAPCKGCSAGQIAVTFTSATRDSDHFDGTFVVDPSSRTIVSIECQPAVLPKGADSGVFAVKFGRVMPDLWSVVEIRQDWTGHMLFIHGSRDVTITYSNYRRFASNEQAHKAILAGI